MLHLTKDQIIEDLNNLILKRNTQIANLESAVQILTQEISLRDDVIKSLTPKSEKHEKV